MPFITVKYPVDLPHAAVRPVDQTADRFFVYERDLRGDYAVRGILTRRELQRAVATARRDIATDRRHAAERARRCA